MLVFHVLFLLTVAELELPQLLLLLPQFFIELTYLLIIVTFLVQSLQSLLLLPLYFQEGLVLILDTFKDALFVLKFILELNDLLDIVRTFELTTHGIDFLFVESDLVQGLL